MKSKINYVVLVVLLIAGCGSKEELEEAVRPVFYQEIGKSIVQNTPSFSGVTQAADETRLSFKVGGTIEKLNVEMGANVAKGNVIARLDDDDYQINYNKAVVAQKNAAIQLETAKSSFLRIENLYANNSISLNDYERAKAQFESAEAMVKTAQSQLKAAQNQLDYTLLRAPYSGVISAVLAKENEMAGPGQPIVVFSSVNNIEVKTAVPENIIGQIRKDQDVAISFRAFTGKKFKGKITEVSPGTPNASAYPVIMQLLDAPEQLYPGMTATVEIPLYVDGKDSKDIAIVVADAVGRNQTGDYVFIANYSSEKDTYIVERKNVILGELRPEGYQIIEGLNKGDIVITAGLSFLFEGREVRLLDENELNK